MPAPYPPPQQPAAAERAKFELDAKSILALAAVALGLISWLLGFFGSAGTMLSGTVGAAVIGTAVLAGMWLLPRVPSSVVAMVPLAVYATLALLQALILAWTSAAPWAGGGPASVVLVLLVLLQTVSVVGLLLFEYRILTPPAVGGGATQQVAHPGPAGQPGQPQQGQPQQGQPQQGQPQQGGWNPQSGPYPAQPGAPQQGAPQQGGWNPQSGGFAPGTGQGVAQPGQFGQPQPAQPPQPQPAQPQPAQPQPAQPQEYAQPGSFAQQPYQGGQQNPYARPNPHEQQSSQEQQGDPSGGPQGTQQMPHPGQQPPS
ncbi:MULTISPECIES: DUF5336 domain-containing protein [unclassified Actinopolyspora]|uniref:DUF5336 domain-containing protein n=1 Tax=unclassified Actinopolyspora TaxID=2639451 RepID=UPI0013F5B96E|nr:MULTISPECIES: DUF5336 domain-containing protein [unclassified Actinopolyspora]NHD16724.1 DUF5336 domain-containing protein [Actinopolyspora sp. BKK2]NHE75413.1 DUF5336 domain-containing protein [Actinopolyspora sp. BKK1]